MKKGEMLGTMLVIATNAHAGQFDRGGAPYILHPLKVMHYLKSDDEELMCMALGHDVIEDTPVTYKDLRDGVVVKNPKVDFFVTAFIGSHFLDMSFPGRLTILD